MSKKYPGGIITKSPATPTGPLQNGSAPGVWTMDQAAYWIKQGVWPTAGNSLYWFGIMSPPTGWTNVSSSSPRGVAISPTDQSIIATINLGPTSGAYYTCYAPTKISLTGNVQWMTPYYYTTGGDLITSPRCDSAGDVYCAGYSGGNNRSLIMKLNGSTGAVTFARQSNAARGDIFVSLAGPDGSGNVYAVGYVDTTSGLSNFWTKFDSSGSLLINYTTVINSNIGTDSYLTDLSMDSTGNTYAGGTNFAEAIYMKFSPTSANLVASRLGNGTYGGGFTCLIVEGPSSPTHFYAVAYSYQTGATCNLWKVSQSNGTSVAWSYNISGLNPYGAIVTTDSSGNVYLFNSESTNNYLVIMKFNSSGTLQWQRGIAYSGSTLTPTSIVCDNTNNAIVLTAGAGTNLAIMRLPNDGSLTGTYGNWQYYTTSYSLTTAVGTWNTANPLNRTWSGSFVSATGTATTATTSIAKTGV